LPVKKAVSVLLVAYPPAVPEGDQLAAVVQLLVPPTHVKLAAQAGDRDPSSSTAEKSSAAKRSDEVLARVK
jgi:hypothetical protein